MHAVNKKILYNVIHLQQQPDILCGNDAKSCYKHIVHSVVSTAMKLLGIPVQPMKYMLGMLQDMEHHIRTSRIT